MEYNPWAREDYVATVFDYVPPIPFHTDLQSVKIDPSMIPDVVAWQNHVVDKKICIPPNSTTLNPSPYRKIFIHYRIFMNLRAKLLMNSFYLGRAYILRVCGVGVSV